MKERLDKYFQIGLGMLVSFFVVYTWVAAHHACCSPVNTSLSSLDGISGPSVGCNFESIPVPQNRHVQLRADICRINHPASCGAGTACCRTGCCAGYGQSANAGYFSTRSVYSVNNNPIFFVAPNSVQSAFISLSLQASFKPLPLYILAQTILC